MPVPAGSPYFSDISAAAVGNQISTPTEPGYYVSVTCQLTLNGWGGHSGVVQARARCYIGAIQAWDAIEQRGLIWEAPDVRPRLYMVENAATPIYGELAPGTYPLIVVGVYHDLVSTDLPFGFQTGTGTLIVSGASPDTIPADVPGGAVPLGIYQQEIVTWTGDGAAGRLIATSFALNSGVVAVWVFNQGPSVGTPVFRHSGMTVSSIQAGQTSAVLGITGFEAGGFRLGADGVNWHVNVLASKYTAIVLRDTTGGQYFSVGAYVGVADLGFTPDVVGVDGGPVPDLHLYINAGNVPQATDSGRAFVITTPPGGSGNYTYINASLGGFLTGQWGGASGRVNGTILGSGRRLASHHLENLAVLVFGTWTAYCPNTFAPDKATWLEAAAFTTYSNQILALNAPGGADGPVVTTIGPGGIGSNVNVNLNNYYWVAFSTDMPPALFALYHGVGGVGGGAVVSGLGFTPAFVVHRVDDVNNADYGRWRGPTHTGANSSGFTGGDSTGRITALAAGTITLGTTGAPAGKAFDGFALAVSGEAVPDYTPPPFPPIATVNEVFDAGGAFASAAGFAASEGPGLPIRVPDQTTAGQWGVDRVDVKVRREERG